MMLLRSAVIVLVVVLLSYELYAQTEAEPDSITSDIPHEIGVVAGYWLLQSRDEGGSPYTYSGAGQPLLLTYQYRGDEYRHTLKLIYVKTGINAPELRAANSQQSMESGVEMVNHTADYSYRGLQYGYSIYIPEMFDRSLQLYLGGLWDNILFFRYYTYGYRQLEDRSLDLLTWEAVSSFNLHMQGDYQLGERNRIHFSMHTPFLAYVVRPRYAVQEDQLLKIDLDNFSKLNTGRGRFATINDLRQMHLSLGYDHMLSSRFAARLIYDFIYYRYMEPRRTVTAINSLGASLLFKF